jgi:uridylate kinase
MNSRYKRILLKMSGEALAGERGFGVDSEIMKQVASEIKIIHKMKVQVAVVIGGGNFFRGGAAEADGMNRADADMVGMLATIMNSLLFKESLEEAGVQTRVFSAIKVEKAAEFYTPKRAINHLNKGRIIIIAGGTGNPYFTTDTAAALRCAEIKCDAMLKATKVDGVYDSDPAKNPNAVKIDSITHYEALNRNIRVMDATAFSMCMENSIPIIVFKLLEPGNLKKCIEGKKVGSIVKMGG